MDVLLDTHVFLWWLSDDQDLSQKARNVIASSSNSIVVSAATAWEIAIKRRLGKLEFDGDPETEVSEQGFRMLPVRFSHASEVGRLPSFHRDPFDRMLVAQARVENMGLLTVDPMIVRYPANIIQG